MKTYAPGGDPEVSLSRILLDDAWHREALEALREVAPFAWITGGFVRNAIWDATFGKRDFCTPADVDVIYLETQRRSLLTEGGLGTALSRVAPAVHWSVRDQGRMHMRSSDPPYQSVDEALRAFPDRSSAIAVRLLPNGSLEILAPFGLEDAFQGIVRPTPAGLSDGRFQRFLDRKLAGWRSRWPWLKIASDSVQRRGSSRHAA